MKMRRNQTIIATMCFLLNFYSVSMRAVVVAKIDYKLIEENKADFKKFVYEKKSSWEWVNVMPKWAISIGGTLAGYSKEDIENSATVNRYFDNKNDNKLREYIEKVGSQEDLEVLNEILKGLASGKSSWVQLQERLHEQTMKFLGLENERFSRGKMKIIFNQWDNGNSDWRIPDEKYFLCMTRTFMALFLYEKKPKLLLALK
jgi:hypothetical protein